MSWWWALHQSDTVVASSSTTQPRRWWWSCRQCLRLCSRAHLPLRARCSSSSSGAPELRDPPRVVTRNVSRTTDAPALRWGSSCARCCAPRLTQLRHSGSGRMHRTETADQPMFPRWLLPLGCIRRSCRNYATPLSRCSRPRWSRWPEKIKDFRGSWNIRWRECNPADAEVFWCGVHRWWMMM